MRKTVGQSPQLWAASLALRRKRIPHLSSRYASAPSDPLAFCRAWRRSTAPLGRRLIHHTCRTRYPPSL